MALEVETIFLPILFLLGATCFTVQMRAMQTLGKIQTKRLFQKKSSLFFFYFFQKKVFRSSSWDNVFFLISSAKHILRMLYAVTAFVYITNYFFTPRSADDVIIAFGWILLEILIITAIALILDLTGRVIAQKHPFPALKAATPLATAFQVLFSPITFLFLKLQKWLFPSDKKMRAEGTSALLRDQILEFVHESELSTLLSAVDRHLITSVASFRERTAKEIMVPRIDIFALDVKTPVHKAAQAMIPEGYSRIPVFKDSIDNMIGVLLYKDVVRIYFEAFEKSQPDLLHSSLDSSIHPILFSPETKPISKLLQEFRSKQSHLAIIVDEYGGTEGIVTIEDILEELVGEIADEYDVNEEKLYKPYPNGGWIVDARMNVLDIEKQLGIHLPQNPEYDTLGGFIVHKAGTIPKKGWRLHTDPYTIEVLSSSERSVDKVWVVPPQEEED